MSPSSRCGATSAAGPHVRDAPNADVERSIRPGGISKVKSARIQQILREIDIDDFDERLARLTRRGGARAS